MPAPGEQTQPVHPHQILGAWGQALLKGRRIAVLGDTSTGLSEQLAELCGRRVHAYDPEPTRAAASLAEGRSNKVTYGSVDRDLALRQGAYDAVVIPDLTAMEDAKASINHARELLSRRGILVLASDSAGGPGYYELYDMVSEAFDEVTMLGQAPFAGFTVAAFGSEGEPAVLIDSSLMLSSEEPRTFLVVAGDQPAETEPYTLVQLPARVAGAWMEGPRPELADARELAEARLDGSLLREELRKLKEQEQERSKELSDKQHLEKSLSMRVAELERELSAHRSKGAARAKSDRQQIAELKKQHGQSQEQLKQLRSEQQDQLKQLDAEQQDQLKQLNAEQQGQLKQLKQQNAEQQGQLKQLKQQNAEQQDQLKQLKRQNAEQQGQLKQLRSEQQDQLKQLKQQNAEQQGQLKQLRSEQQEQLKQLNTEQQEQLSNAEEQFQNELDTMLDRIAELEEELAIATSVGEEAERSDASQQAQGPQPEASQPEAAPAEAPEQDTPEPEQDAEAAHDEQAHAFQISELKNALAAARQQVDDLRARDEQHQTLRAQLASTQEQLDSFRADAQQPEDEQHTKDIDRLERLLLERGGLVDQLRKDLHENERTGRELVAELLEAQKRPAPPPQPAEPRATEPSEHDGLLMTLESSPESQSEQLTPQLESLLQRCSRYEADLQAASWKIDSLTAELEQLQHDATPDQIKLETALRDAHEELAKLRDNALPRERG